MKDKYSGLVISQASFILKSSSATLRIDIGLNKSESTDSNPSQASSIFFNLFFANLLTPDLRNHNERLLVN